MPQTPRAGQAVLHPQRRNRHGKLAPAAITSQISLLCFNSRSLCNKLDILYQTLSSYSYQILAVTETWLTEKYPDSLITSGLDYSIFRCDRKIKTGGGVCLFVQNCLSVTPVLTANVLNSSLLSVDINDPVAHSGVRISLAYIPPSATAEEVSALCDNAAEILTTNQEHVFLGDFNLPSAFSEAIDVVQSPAESDFRLFCNNLNLEQIVSAPTRGNNLLDLILVSDVFLTTCINDCSVLEPFSTSDHNSVKLVFTMPAAPYTRERFLDYHKADFLSLNRFIFSTDWNVVFADCQDINSAVTVFNSIVSQGISLFVPTRTRKLQIQTMPEYIRKLFDYRALLWKDIACPIIRRKFNSISVKLNKLMKKFIQNREKHILAKKPTKIFNYVSTQLKPKNGKLPALNVNGSIITENSDKCELFAEHFFSCFNPLPCTDAEINPLFSSAKGEVKAFCVSPLEVFEMLEHCQLKNNSSPDAIPFVILRKCSAALTYPVYFLFDMSIKTGVVPEIWKESLVVPVPKKGDKSDFRNYRPISLTCSLARILEKHVSKTLLKHWDESSVLPPSQHGFRQSMSTTTQLIECHDHWTTEVDAKNPIDVLYVDLKRAFDSIPIPRLLLKIAATNVTDKALKWLESFLISRQFSVKIDKALSSKRLCISGIPAGTCLGPLLFIFFIADLPAECETEGVKPALFADDLKAAAVVLNDEPPLLQIFSDRVATYCINNGLSLANEKCFVLHVGLNNPQLEYSCNGAIIPSTTEAVRDLGVYVTADLKFKEHISRIVSNASRRLFCLLKAVRSRDPELLALLFNVYVRPVLEYASPVFNPPSKVLTLELEKVQRRASKLILGRTSQALRDLPFLERYRLLHMETLERRRLIADLILYHKHLLGKAKITTNSVEYYISVKGNVELRCPRARLQAREASFFVRVVRVYSKLPTELVTINSVSGFQQALLDLDISRFATFFV
jgi:hypothetical protein